MNMEKKLYIGKKLAFASPMTRSEYNVYRGWELPENEKELWDEAGYLVEYIGEFSANHPKHKGHITWSPAEVFNNTFSEFDNGLSFGQAIDFIKGGERVCRAGWNGKGMFLFFIKGSTVSVNTPPLTHLYPVGHKIKFLPSINMKTADGSIVPWLASQSDVLADDWMLLDRA